MALTKVSTGMIETGTASVDLDIDSGTLYIDVTNGRVGVSNSSPATALDVTGTATATLFSGSGASLTNIPNVALDNSSITINSQLTALGGSVTLSTSEVGEGTRLYYTDARWDTKFAAASTTGLSEGTNLYYTDARADARVSLIVDAAPETLNTLNELAAALGDDANFSTTVTNSIATKLPLAGGALTGNLTTNSRVAIGQSSVTGGNVLLDLHGSGNSVGALSAYYNDHNTSGFFVGIAGNITGNPILYNVPDTNIEFYTNNAIAMTIASSGTTFAGNVGIGATPNTRLHVSSAVTTKSVVETTGTSSDALIEFTKGQGSGNTWSMGLDHSNSSAFSLAYLSNGSPSLTTHGLVTVDTSGNVGIGTDNPAAPLHTQFSNNDGGVGGHLIKNTNTGTTSNFASLSTHAVNGTIQGTFGSAHYSTWGGAAVFAGSQSAHPLKIITGNAVIATFDTSGNVGIGPNNPQTSLHLSKTTTGPIIRLENSTNGIGENVLIGGIEWFNSDTSGEGPNVVSAIESYSASSLGNDGYLTFSTYDSAESDVEGQRASEKMRITADGNVGIGTTIPNSYTDETTLSINGVGFGRLDLEAGGTLRSSLFSGSTYTALVVGTSRIQVQSSSDIEFQTQNTIQLIVKNDGKVGIGTDSPTQKLEVAGTALVENAKLKAIAASNSDTAVDVFVYDTRKDSDGGAWRKRTQHTSWYNETLNTATRGVRKEFPSVAVIVAEADTITIYDGDDPDLPMWMVFNGSSIVYQATRSSVAILNGIMFTGGSTSVTEVNFLTEFMGLHQATAISQTKPSWAGGIVNRNDTGGNWTTEGAGTGSVIKSGTLVNQATNDVAMTILPNAPIDADTGLPVPTIAVGTVGGTSVITDSGNVYDITGFSPTTSIDFYGSKLAFSTEVSSDSYITVGSSTVTSDITIENWRDYKGDYNVYGTQGIEVLTDMADHLAYGNAIYSAGVNGLTAIDHNESDGSLSMGAIIASDYNTGWMHGDIKLATLSDTDATNVTRTELITNGTFDTDVSGWDVSSGGSITWNSGRMQVITPGVPWGGASQGFATTVGKRYIATFDVISNSSTAGVSISQVGPVSAAKTTYTGVFGGNSYKLEFTATTTTAWIAVDALNTSDVSTIVVDNFSVTEAEEDRSVNGNGLEVFGTVTKTAVATGADLVAYSGFSSSNYLQQPYNSDLDFGTGDFSFSGWFYSTSVASQGLFSRVAEGLGGTQSGFAMNTAGSGVLGWSMYTTGLHSPGRTNCGFGFTPALNVWNHIVAMRKSGVMYLYLNGVLDTSLVPANTDNITDTSNSPALKVGILANGGSPATATKMALWRISATAPSEEQIIKMYNDEKHLFQENTKATLYGSSDAVTALAYDDDTELLHVGTSAGRSVFQGLNRVDNTTDAVSAAISASNGFIVED